MFTFIIGGSASGKSEYAEGHILTLGRPTHLYCHSGALGRRVPQTNFEAPKMPGPGGASKPSNATGAWIG